jgi:hypothetical protein
MDLYPCSVCKKTTLKTFDNRDLKGVKTDSNKTIVIDKQDSKVSIKGNLFCVKSATKQRCSTMISDQIFIGASGKGNYGTVVSNGRIEVTDGWSYFIDQD